MAPALAGHWLLVMLGGALGAGARFGVSRLLPKAAGGFPWATLAVNVGGGLLMGAVFAWLMARAEPAPGWRAFLMTGVLGGFTTFSAFALDVFELVSASPPDWGKAALYLAASVAGSLLALVAGVVLVRIALAS